MGVWVETLTPMGEDYEILYSSLHSQYAHLEKSGISTIIPLSPVGEFATMIHQEKVEYLRTLGQESGKMRIFPQVGHASSPWAHVLPHLGQLLVSNKEDIYSTSELSLVIL